MLSPAQRGEIRLLSQHGFSQRRIARLVGRNRATVGRVLLSTEPGGQIPSSEQLQPRHCARRSRKIDAFETEATRAITVRGLTINQTWDVLKAAGFIHNSDYPSVEACKAAIDRYFAERNQYFRRHPKRAGNKLWGKEPVPPVFAESQNCKDPHYR